MKLEEFLKKGYILLALRATLRMLEDNPSTHQKLCEYKLMIKGQLDKDEN
jgi:hypothetical protein